MVDIVKNINKFIEPNFRDPGRNPENRYASFDYCYNYFQAFRESGTLREMSNDANIEMSCLQLGYYLASWGMLRGSSFLLTKASVTIYKPIIEMLSERPEEEWAINVSSYDDTTIDQLLKLEEKIKLTFGPYKDSASDTLATKILLGVMGNVPAFDTNFNNGYKRVFGSGNGFGKKALNNIGQFYQKNKMFFDEIKISTFDFSSGKEMERFYPEAKLIDMSFFIEGEE